MASLLVDSRSSQANTVLCAQDACYLVLPGEHSSLPQFTEEMKAYRDEEICERELCQLLLFLSP